MPNMRVSGSYSLNRLACRCMTVQPRRLRSRKLSRGTVFARGVDFSRIKGRLVRKS